MAVGLAGWLTTTLACTPSERMASADDALRPIAPASATLSSEPVDVEPRGWAAVTQSPWQDDGSARIDPREEALAARCGHPDAALRRVARTLVDQRVKGLGAPDPDAVTAMLRAAGEPHLSPRVLSASGQGPLDDASLHARLDALGDPQRSGLRAITKTSRCAVATARTAHGGELLVALAVDVLADLAPLPSRARTGSWLAFSARAHAPLRSAKLVLLGPHGAPRTVPTALDVATGEVRARFALDRPGAFTVQLVGELDDGPRPLLEARVFADVEPPSSADPEPAPGEEIAPDTTSASAASLLRMIAALRSAEGLPPLGHDERLAELARIHAEKMREQGAVAHDLGAGDVRTRFENEGGSGRGRAIGENVAHARSLALAHRALYASASHRMNLVRADYTHVGVGVAEADDGSVYVCEVFLAR